MGVKNYPIFVTSLLNVPFGSVLNYYTFLLMNVNNIHFNSKNQQKAIILSVEQRVRKRRAKTNIHAQINKACAKHVQRYNKNTLFISSCK